MRSGSCYTTLGSRQVSFEGPKPDQHVGLLRVHTLTVPRVSIQDVRQYVVIAESLEVVAKVFM